MVLLLLTGSLCLGAVVVSVLSPVKEVGPGEFATNVFSVLNDSTASDVFHPEIEAPEGFVLLNVLPNLSLAPGEEGTLFVAVSVSPGVTAGEYAVVLRATSQSDPAVQGEASATIVVSPVNEVEILPPSGGSVIPGDEILYQFTVVNRGNVQDSFQVEATSANRFPIHLSRELLSLAPQERATVEIRLQVPMDTSHGLDLLTVDASSTLYPAVRDEVTLFTTILPPLPQAVGGTLMEELPAWLRFSIDQDVFSKELNSNLTFLLFGEVEDGYLFANLLASPIFGPDPLEVGSFSVLYRRTPMTYVIGDTSKKLTDLLRLSCRGGRVDIDAGTYDLVFLGGGADGETRVGGHLSLGPEEANVGIAYMERKDENDQRAVWSLTAEAEPLEDWSLRMEGALGINNGLTSRAVFFSSKIDTISYFLNVEALSVGTYFPGLHADEAGIGLSQRLRIEDLSLGTSLSHMWDNVIRDPLVLTTITDELGLNFYVTPLEEGPTITSTVGFTWERGENLTLENEIERLLSVAMSDTQGEFPYSFSAKLTDRIDHVANAHYRTLSFSEGVGLSIEGFDLFLKLTQEKTEDYLTGDLLTGGTDVSLRFSSNSSLHSATITLANAKDWFDLTLEVDVLLLEDLHVLLDTTLGWDRADATASTLSLGMSFDLGFKLPIPFLVTKARIEGRVYDDSNANGQCDQGEKGIPDLLLALADTQALTGEDGQFRFPPLLPGDYSLQIVNLPFPYVPPASLPIPVHLEAGVVEQLEVPVVEGAMITGQVAVFHGEPSEGLYLNGAGEEDTEGPSIQGEGLPDVSVKLTSDEETFYQTTDRDGFFRFDRLRPGHWTVTVDDSQLPRFNYLERDVFEVDLEPGERIDLLIKVFERHRPIQFIGEGELQVEEEEKEDEE